MLLILFLSMACHYHGIVGMSHVSTAVAVEKLTNVPHKSLVGAYKPAQNAQGMRTGVVRTMNNPINAQRILVSPQLLAPMMSFVLMGNV